MLRAFVALSTFFLALIWQVHANVFLPSWMVALPLWAWCTAAICLEIDLDELAMAGAFMATWYVLARVEPFGGLVAWVAMATVGCVMLRTWLAHRSLLSAYTLLFLGHVAFFLAEAAVFAWSGEGSVPWGALARSSAQSFGWNAFLVGGGMRIFLWARRRLRGYVSAAASTL